MKNRGRPKGRYFNKGTTTNLSMGQLDILEHNANILNVSKSTLIRTLIDECLLPVSVPAEFAEKCRAQDMLKFRPDNAVIVSIIAGTLGVKMDDKKLYGKEIDIVPKNGITGVLQAIKNTYQIITDEESKSIHNGPTGEDAKSC